MTIEAFKKWAVSNGWVLLGEKSWIDKKDTYIMTSWVTPIGFTPYVQFQNGVSQ